MDLVQVDFIKRLDSQSIITKTLMSLIGFSLLYILLVRPMRIKLNQSFFYPKISQVSNEHGAIIDSNSRRINIKLTETSSPKGFGIPFGGYFWLPFALLFPLRNRSAIIGLSLYHLILLIIPPYLLLLLIKGHHWVSTLLDINEMIFLFVFHRGSDFAINNFLFINIYQINLGAYKLLPINK